MLNRLAGAFATFALLGLPAPLRADTVDLTGLRDDAFLACTPTCDGLRPRSATLTPAARGLTLSARGFGFVLGDDALIGPPIAGTFELPVFRLSALFAPHALPGLYTLEGFDSDFTLLRSTTVEVGPFSQDYRWISLGQLSRPAQHFLFTSAPVAPGGHLAEFGVSRIEFRPVPEPSTLLLVGAAAGMLLRRATSRQR